MTDIDRCPTLANDQGPACDWSPNCTGPEDCPDHWKPRCPGCGDVADHGTSCIM